MWRVKILNNGIRIDPTEKIFEPKIEGSEETNHVNIRSGPGERTASPEAWQLLGPARESVCVWSEQGSNWR